MRYFQPKKNPETSLQIEAKRNRLRGVERRGDSTRRSRRRHLERLARGKHHKRAAGIQSSACALCINKKLISRQAGDAAQAHVKFSSYEISQEKTRAAMSILSLVNGERSVALLASHCSHLTCSQQVFWPGWASFTCPASRLPRCTHTHTYVHATHATCGIQHVYIFALI